MLSEFDNLSSSDVEQVQDTYVKYNFSYDKETNIVTLRYQLQYGLFYLAVADKETGKMFVSTKIVNLDIASLAMKTGISCYTPSYTDAYNAAKLASDGFTPVHDEAKYIGYYNHYHRYNRKGVAHAFYGAPKVV